MAVPHSSRREESWSLAMTATRRGFLKATVTTAVGLSPLRAFAQKPAPSPTPSPVMSTLAAYMSAARTRALPGEVTEQAKYHLLDTMAAMISGSELPPGQAAQRHLREHVGNGPATVVGTAFTVPPVDAAMANGMMAHADETDDSHNESRSHPGCAVVPAALAAGEISAIDGAGLLRAVTLGYDIGTRVVMAMGGAAFSYESSLSTHSIAGTFGAAAAACCAVGLDTRQMRWALDYTAQQSSGIAAWRRDTDHIEKAFVFAGKPARDGVTSALAGAVRLERRRRRSLRSGQFLRRLCTEGAAGTADREARRALRDHANRHQEMDASARRSRHRSMRSRRSAARRRSRPIRSGR